MLERIRTFLFPLQMRWRIGGGCAVLGLFFGVIGHLQVPIHGEETFSFLSALYHALQLFTLDGGQFRVEGGAPWTLHAGRYLCLSASVVLVYGVLTRYFGASVRGIWRRMRGEHTVVLGPGPLAVGLAQRAKRSDRVVLVGSKAHASELRELSRGGLPTFSGDLEDPEFLERCSVRRARRIVCASESDEDNLMFAAAMEKLLEGDSHANKPPRGGEGSPSYLPHALRLSRASSGLDVSRGLFQNFRVVQLDPHEHHAREFFATNALDFLPIPRSSTGECGRPVLIVMGSGPLAEEAILYAARVAHYPASRPTSVLWCVSSAADSDRFLRRWPALLEALEFRVVHHEPGSPELRRLLADEFDATFAIGEPVTVAVFGPGGVAERLATAQWLQGLVPELSKESGEVAEDTLPGLSEHVRIVPDLGSHKNLRCLWGNTQFSVDYPNLLPFAGVPLEELLGLDLTSPEEHLARAVHERYLKTRKLDINGNPRPAQRAWNKLSETFRRASRANADHLPIKLAAIGLELVAPDDPRPEVHHLEPEQIEFLSRLEHDRWVMERRLDGWTHDLGHNVRKLEHRLMVPWDELPESERKLDRAFLEWADEAAERAGKKIVRRHQPSGSGGTLYPVEPASSDKSQKPSSATEQPAPAGGG